MDLKSNEPFWLVKNGIIQTYPSLHQDKTCDILIVGGGITGALIAHQCTAMGKSCILIDKREIVNGSSAATTSMLQYEIDTPLYQLKKLIGEEGAIASYRACNKAIDDIGSIARQIKSKAGFRRKDSLYYAARKKDISWLKEEFMERKSAGFKVNWLSADDIQTGYGLAKTYGGILSRHGASLDAFCFAHELLKYNTKQGLEVFDKTELISVRKNRLHSLVKVSTGATIRTKKIIYCTGYETASVIPEKFVDLLSTFAIVSEVDSVLYQQYKDILIWNTSEPYLYMRTTDDGRFLIGGGDEEFHNPQKRDALITRKSKTLEKSFQKIINKPFFTDFSWAGTFGVTHDGLPYIGEHKEFENSYFVCGFGGNGITFSVTAMEMVAFWLENRKHPLSEWFKFGR
ncbi:FAD-dependent oxidoreductase [Sphingobacterium sp. CZ-UAM]|uniref:NAD(P)/FAD-dependent oxidoreductase n=1 Tax=Sphingobacterium sp. CZ-UAM TaxID=1933868 RepID=UPI00098573D3|nr:FAD-binding oxidoreductase [Sphingobacterium sp. CZ-UAM]OOG19485.1 FAD-dependent oxidoreductase [Sphingobacterium sp. CZ-UAM]